MQSRMLILGLSLVFAAQPSFSADKTDPAKEVKKLIPVSTALQDLRMNGYAIVKKIELENDVFNIEAMTTQGEEVSVVMKADSGEIVKPEKNPTAQVSFEDAVKRVEGAGYHDIYKAEYNGSQYVVRAFDQKNKKVKLKVDGMTGEIATAWF